MKPMSLSLDFRCFRFAGINRIKNQIPDDGRMTLYLLIGFYAAGISLGALLIRGSDSQVLEFAGGLFDYFFTSHSAGFTRTLAFSFFSYFKYFAVAFFIGMFIPGAVLAPLFMLVRGAEIGLISGLLYQSGLLSGMVRNAAYIFVTSVVATMILSLAFREAVGFSLSLFSCSVRGREGGLSAGFRLYCLRFLIILSFLFATSLLDAGLSVLWAGCL